MRPPMARSPIESGLAPVVRSSGVEYSSDLVQCHRNSSARRPFGLPDMASGASLQERLVVEGDWRSRLLAGVQGEEGLHWIWQARTTIRQRGLGMGIVSPEA